MYTTLYEHNNSFLSMKPITLINSAVYLFPGLLLEEKPKEVVHDRKEYFRAYHQGNKEVRKIKGY